MQEETVRAPDEIVALKNDLGALMASLKNFAEDVTVKHRQGREISDELKQRTDQALSEVGALRERIEGAEKKAAKLDEAEERIHELEQRLARRGHDTTAGTKSLGQLVIENPDVRLLTSSTRGRARVSISRKDITSAPATVGAGAGASTSLVVADRAPGIFGPGERALTIRDLLMPGQTSSGSIEYVRETGFTNLAAPVAEGAAKPKSDITFNLETAPVRTIAHVFKASRQILDDAPALASYIDGRARYGLRFVEEAQLLLGDGTGQNLTGLIPSATAYVPAFTPAAATAIDTIRLAILQVYLAEFPPNGIVLNPTDWARIELTKDTQNRYIIGSAQDGTTPRLWNLPVVQTQAMAVDDFLVGAFNMGAQIFDRMDIEVLISTENEDDFVKNMVTIRAEERLALAVYRPEAFVYGDLGFVA